MSLKNSEGNFGVFFCTFTTAEKSLTIKIIIMRKITFSSALLFSILISFYSLSAQELNTSEIKSLIGNLKQDTKGPYYRIKWFCKDGTERAAKDPCPEGGNQHASYKPEVKTLAKNHHIFLGNILATSSFDTVWDASNNHSRLKQYQIVKYLSSIDEGWIYKKGQFYRGSMQSEDEEAWGKEFYSELLKDNSVLNSNYYLIKQSLKDIPHLGDSNLSQLIRSQSKVIAEEVSSFMKIRIKIHGNPDKTDITAVENYKVSKGGNLNSEQNKKLEELLKNLKTYYTPVSVSALKEQVNSIKGNQNTKDLLSSILSEYEATSSPSEKVRKLTDVICNIRQDIETINSTKDKLTLLDLSNKVETSIFIQSQEWKPSTLKGLLEKIQVLSYATLGSGLIEFWEWDQAPSFLSQEELSNSMTLAELTEFLTASKAIVQWSTAMVKAVYEEDVQVFNSFEPKSHQFIDDRIRSSVVLDLGNSVSQLGAIISEHSNIENDILDIKKQSTIKGLNPGYAFGELVVVNGPLGEDQFDKDKIFVFERPTSGLKPVAGIMTVSAGNLVSHVQLLARNLGIPNATLSNSNLESLLKYNGKKVFYAVSEKGNVILKLEKDMNQKEKDLFSKKQHNTNKIKVPVERIKLDQIGILNLRDVQADDSGVICGPKAANLGQLKSIFPDHVVEGFVIPFGIFRKHLDNQMDGQNMTYWKFLNETYSKAEEMKDANKSENEINAFQVSRLTTLRIAIEKMELNKDFVTELEESFKNILGSKIGTQSVFLRSDTNMEDLKEFTGAGLNLTLFNILSKEDILNGIKEVWASPYTDRSLRWRQKYLLNPEYVFPSIVVIPGVNNDYSGVVITTGINEGEKEDMTVAFSRGVGGAVDGQAAEMTLITKNSSKLLAPSREPDYLSLPSTGGTKENFTTFEKSILNNKNKQTIRDLVKEVRMKVPERTDPDYKGAYDMEMGFKNDKLWLFQIRPFVENKKAKNSEYLNSIAPKVNYSKKISLTDKI